MWYQPVVDLKLGAKPVPAVFARAAGILGLTIPRNAADKDLFKRMLANRQRVVDIKPVAVEKPVFIAISRVLQGCFNGDANLAAGYLKGKGDFWNVVEGAWVSSVAVSHNPAVHIG